MTTELSVWDQIRGTHNTHTEKRALSRGFPFGLLGRFDTRWTASARDESATVYYNLDATEHRPEGIVARLIEPTSSMTVTLSERAGQQINRGSQKITYLARLADGELLDVSGMITRAADNTGRLDMYPETTPWSDPVAMDPEEALAGFTATLAEAPFRR